MKSTAARMTRLITPQLVFWSGLVFALLLAMVQAGYFLFVQDEFAVIAVNDILSAVSSLAAALGMAYGAWWSFHLDRRLGGAWRLFMLAMACWAMGDILWTYYELVLDEAPYPSIGDLFYLSTYPLFFIGILRMPRQGGTSTRAAWLWLDIFIVMFSAIGIYWNFIIGPSVLGDGQSWLEVLVNSAYPAGDLLLILVITLIIFLPRSPLWKNPMYLMLVGHGLSAVGDSIFAYQTINETYASSTFFNILFSIGPLVLMLSGLSQAALAQQIISGQKTIPLRSKSSRSVFLRLVIPFVWLLFAYLLLGFSAASKHALTSIQFSIWLSALIIMLAIRQVLSTMDNNRLAGELQTMNDDLEKRVAERATDLIMANSDLRREMEERKRIEMMLREREEKLAHFALHDGLTSLPNRSLLIDRLSQAIQRHRRHMDDLYAILFLDLDSFKVVNDSLGHLAGDQLLMQVGQRLTSLVRAEDTVARLGGDEFVILIEGFQDNNLACVAANRILDALKEPFSLDSRSIYITASIGVVIADPGYSTAIEVLRDADLAMYEAKTNGKARNVVFSAGLRLSAINRLTLDSDLHQALKLNEFVLHYQPVVSLVTDRIVSFEALIRWQHPTRGLVGPSEFIPVAESDGIIDSITRWTIQEACRQLSEWQTAFPFQPPLSVSVNLSPHSLRRPELFQWIEESLRTSSLSAQYLILEIVETALIQDADLAKRAFTDLRKLGIEVSLDDFGIGYSSLGYINQYPIDELKIDRTFVSRVTETKEVDAIVRAVTKLACELDIKVVAEGIETQAQLDFMKQTGCQYGQGFFLSKPLDPPAVSSLLQRL